MMSDDQFVRRMLKKFSGLSKDMLVYGAGGALIQLFGLITVPIVTRLFSPEEYGTIDLIYQSMGYLSVLLGMNVTSGLLRYFYEASTKDPSEQQRMVSTTFWSAAGPSFLAAAILSAFARPFSQWLFNTSEPASALQLAAYTVPLQLLFGLLTALQRLERRPSTYIALNIGYALINYALVITFVAVLRVGLIGIFIAQICAYTVGVLAAMLLANRLIGFAFSWHWMRKVYGYALPMVPAALMTWWLATSNRFFLNTYRGLAEVGYYAVASKIAMAMQFIVQTFILAWEPFMLENLKNPEAPRIYAVALKYYSLGMLAIGAIISAFARDLFLIMAPVSYLPGTALVAFIVLRYILNGAGYITGVGVVAREMSYYYSVALFCGLIANLASNLLLTPRYGIYGAAISEATGIVVSTLVTSYISWRLMPIRWKLVPPALASLGFVLTSIITNNLSSLAESWNMIWLLLIKLALLVVYFSAMALLIERKYLDLMFVELPRRLARRIM